MGRPYVSTQQQGADMNRLRLALVPAFALVLVAAAPAQAETLSSAPPLVCYVSPLFGGDAICVEL